MHFAVLSLALLSFPAFAQSELPGCEPRPEVRQALKEKLDYRELDKLKFTDRLARQHEVIDALIAKYPRELEPYRRLISLTRYSEPDQFPALQARFREQAAQKPDDPLAAYLAAMVLLGTDTPEAVRLLESAHAKAPNFAWPAQQLADFYSGGKRADQKKSAQYLAEFFGVCTSSTDNRAQWSLSKGGDTALQARVAAALRQRLAAETDPDRLRGYETLWGLEFRSRPPQEHAALRKQIAEDVKRLEAVNSKPDGEWLALLKTGYKQSGASPETLTALDDRILKEYPTSDTAYSVSRERWRKAHKEPEDHKDTTAWTAYDQAYREALKGWIRDFPDDSYLSRAAWFYTIEGDTSLPEKEGLAALDHYLKAAQDYQSPDSYTLMNGAEFLIQHKWQPKRALDLLHRAQPLLARERKRDQNDNIADDKKADRESGLLYQQQEFDGLLLQAARLAGRSAEAQALRTSVETDPPKIRKRESDYWRNRARFAALEGRKADALTYYQLALQSRVSPPNFWRGKFRDDLSDEARAMWKEMNGSDAAWSVWSKPPASKPQEAADGRWEKPTKALPAFELADLSGKTWKLATLEGKSVLINLWATWCGPCNAELPQLQKLYDTVKDKPGVQILTFNIDEDLGLVEPYMKEKGYTFPVLPAFSFVTTLLDGFAIPQNWIVDPKGAWRWTQIGYGGEPDWVGVMIERMESLKKSE